MLASNKFVSIPCRSLVESIDTLTQLKATLGQNCHINLDTFTLQVSLELIDHCIAQDLQTPPPPRFAEKPPIVRIDKPIRMLPYRELELAKLQSAFYQNWTAAANDYRLQRQAHHEYQYHCSQLRDRIVAPYARTDVSGLTLVYGKLEADSRTPPFLSLDYPNGQAITVQTLIHYTHPSSAEELALREQRIQAERIIRYYVPGLDDAAWVLQNEPRDRLDAIGWRTLIRRRLHFSTL